MKKIALLISLSALLVQCRNDGLSRSISFYNTSGRPVYYYMSWQYYDNGICHYPDTILPEKQYSDWGYSYLNEFNERTTHGFGDLGFTENDLFAAFIPSDTMSIVFFDPDTLAKYEWEIIRQKYKVLVRYDLSHNDLKRLNWCIYYPPTEAMKDMKMYPPFKQ